MFAAFAVAAGATDLAVEVVARPPERSRVEDAWCTTDLTGNVQVLAATDQGVEAWSSVSPEWRIVVAGADHTGSMSGLAGATFARWVAGAEPPAEAGAVSMDGQVVFREPLAYLSNTSTEIAAWVSSDAVTLAMKLHKERVVRIASGQPPFGILDIPPTGEMVRVDPAILQFAPDGSRLLVGGTGPLYVIQVGTDELVEIDAGRQQRAARLGNHGRTVVYSIPGDDRTRLAKADARSGRRIWLSDPLTNGETWGVQALDHLASVDAWIGVVDDQIVAVRDRDGRRLAFAAAHSLPESQWTGYHQLAEWFRPPAVVSACSDATLLVSNLAGRLEIWRIVKAR